MISDSPDQSLNPITLNVENLSYKAVPDAIENFEEYLHSLLHFGKKIEKTQSYSLENISFCAKPGEITGIVGSGRFTRKSILDILAGRRKYGNLSGNIYMTRNGNNPLDIKNFPYFSNLTFISRVIHLFFSY